MDKIKIGKYVHYSIGDGLFCLEGSALEEIYRNKEIICSYSGANEWCNHFFCQMIDLFSGSSPYNYALGTCDHEKEIPMILANNKDKDAHPIVDWITKQENKDWWKKMVDSFEFLFDNLPKQE